MDVGLNAAKHGHVTGADFRDIGGDETGQNEHATGSYASCELTCEVEQNRAQDVGRATRLKGSSAQSSVGENAIRSPVALIAAFARSLEGSILDLDGSDVPAKLCRRDGKDSRTAPKVEHAKGPPPESEGRDSLETERCGFVRTVPECSCRSNDEGDRRAWVRVASLFAHRCVED